MIRHEETLMAANLRELYEELRREGRQEGVQEGRRSVLRQLALRKFGPEVAGGLSHLFDELTDAGRVEALGSAIIECETGAEFLARAKGA